MHTQNMHAQQQQLINGAWVVGDAEPFTKHDPVAGTLLWQGAAASSRQVSTAVEAARRYMARSPRGSNRSCFKSPTPTCGSDLCVACSARGR